jgi:MFS family permease
MNDTAPGAAAAHGRSAFLPWLYWGIGASFFCFSFFLRVSPSVMVQDLMRDFAVGGAVLGNLSAFYLYAYAGAQLPVGVLHDRFGPRRVLAAAALLCGVGCVLFASAPDIVQAYAGRALIGAGSAFAWIGTLKVVTVWFPPGRFAGLAGMTAMIGMAGALGAQAPLAFLVQTLGWRAVLFGGAGLATVLAALTWLVLRDRPVEARHEAVRPRRAGSLRDVGIVLRNPHTWSCSLVVATLSVPLMTFAGLWGVPYMMAAHDLARPAAAAANSMVMLGWGVGAPLNGLLSDRTRRRKPALLVGAVVAYGAILAVVYAPGLPLPAVLVLLFATGFAGSSCVVGFAAARELNPPESSATTMAIVNTIPMALSAACQPLIGWLLDRSWTGESIEGARVYGTGAYHVAFLTLVACAVVAVASAASVRETHGRQADS